MKRRTKKWKITDILEAIANDPETAKIRVPGGYTRGTEARCVLGGSRNNCTEDPLTWVRWWFFSLPAAVGLPTVPANDRAAEAAVCDALVAEAERLNVPRRA